MKTALEARARYLSNLANAAICYAVTLGELGDSAGAEELHALANRLRHAQHQTEDAAAKL